MISRNRDLLIKISISLFSVVTSLILLEGLAHLFLPASGEILFVPDREVGYRHAPDQVVWLSDEAGEYAAWFTTNQFGDPDTERLLEKPDSVYRIAIIGDSMVEAAQVSVEERFTFLLEKELNDWIQERQGPVTKVEVLNFGASGYSTAQELLNYRTHVRNFAPDLVILVFLPGNDVKNNSYQLEVVGSCRPEIGPFFTFSADQELVLVNEDFYELALARYQKTDLAPGEKIKELVRERIRIVDLAYRGYLAVSSGGITSGQAAQLNQDACQTETTLQLYDLQVQQTSPLWKEAWRLTRALLEQLSHEVALDGGSFQMVTVTGPWEVQGETRDLVLTKAQQDQYDWEYPHRMITEIAEELEIPHFQLLPAMKSAVQEGIAVHYLYNGHYTPAGHQVLARELLPILQEYLQTNTR